MMDESVFQAYVRSGDFLSALRLPAGRTLIRGDMFSTGLLGKKHGSKMVQPFIEIGHSFGKYGYFHESIIVEYASPEYLSEKQIRQLQRLSKFSRWLMDIIAKRLGCTERLDAMPYDK